MTRPQLPRVGLIVPSSNTIVERDFSKAGLAASTHVARVYLAETTEAAERRMLSKHVPGALRDLATLKPDVVVFACTSAGAVLGSLGEAQLIDSITRGTGARVISTNRAVKDAIGIHQPRAVAVITPYEDQLNKRIKAGLESEGYWVPLISGMGITDNRAIADISVSEIVTFAKRSLVGASFDLLFVSCTNLRGVDALGRLQRAFDRPVVTSNHATIRRVREVLGRLAAVA